MSAPDLQERAPVVVVTGPTASGKTPLAIELALRFGGEIVNADSMQVFRSMDIGTAKPSPAGRPTRATAPGVMRATRARQSRRSTRAAACRFSPEARVSTSAPHCTD